MFYNCIIPQLECRAAGWLNCLRGFLNLVPPKGFVFIRTHWSAMASGLSVAPTRRSFKSFWSLKGHGWFLLKSRRFYNGPLFIDNVCPRSRKPHKDEVRCIYIVKHTANAFTSTTSWWLGLVKTMPAMYNSVFKRHNNAGSHSALYRCIQKVSNLK